jgi:hypothetical protein
MMVLGTPETLQEKRDKGIVRTITLHIIGACDAETPT